MYRRVGKKEVEGRVIMIRLSTSKDYQINWSGAPVRPRMYLSTGDRGGMDISPRLTNREFMIWSDGFLEGLYSKEGGHES